MDILKTDYEIYTKKIIYTTLQHIWNLSKLEVLNNEVKKRL